MIANMFHLGHKLSPFTEKILRRISSSHALSDQLSYKDKGEGQLQTELDNYFDILLRQFVYECDPGYEIISEESAPDFSTMKNAWILDPLDGTQNMAMGAPIFGVALIRVDNGEVTMGAIFLPARKFMGGSGLYVAGKNQGTWEYCPSGRDRLLQCSTQPDLAKASLLVEGPSKKALTHPAIQKLIRASQRARTNLSATWSTILVASGKLQTKGADILIAVHSKPWDSLIMCLFIEEAGGTVTDLEGNPWTVKNCANLICSNGLLHTQALAVLKNA